MPTNDGKAGPLDWETGVPLASGGSAEVVRAWCPSLGRDIAVKYLKAEDPGNIVRLVREAETQKALEHPHIVRVHQTGIHLGRHYIAMDLVEGEHIDQALEGVDQDTRLTVFEQVLAAVALAHERGVTHRDLKPANILVDQAGGGLHAWVMDFGLARQTSDATLTVTGHAIGTPGYMAPEQARGEKHIDAHADVFALGVILYRLFTGHLPFNSDTPVAMMLQAASGDIAPISSMRRHLPDGLVRIVAKCLEFRPADRYRNARELLADVHAFRLGQTLKARRIGRLYSLQRWARRNPMLALTALVATILVTASAAAALWSWQQSERELATARGLIASAERIRSHWYIDQMRPVHDQHEMRQLAQTALQRLKLETRRAGRRASAEVHSTMADLHYELGDYDTALKLAESAWQAGLRDPSTANRAARALLRRFNDGRIQRSLSVEPELLPELDQQARTDLMSNLTPYRPHLPERTEGLVKISLGEASLVKTQDSAWARLESIEPASPDDWDAMLILAQHQTAESALDLMRDQDRALAGIERVDRALATLIETARSSAAAHLARCQLAAIEANPLNADYDPDAERNRERIGHCRIGLTIRPEDPDLLAARAYWLWQTAKRYLRARTDYVHLLDEAIDLAERSLERAPDNHAARLALGTALQLKGHWAISNGQPESDYLEQARLILQEAHRKYPGSVNIINNLALVWDTIASSRQARGNHEGGEAAHEESILWLQRAAAIRPDDRRLVHNVLATESYLLYHRQNRGIYHSWDHHRLVEDLEGLIKRHPDYPSPYNTLALVWWGLAEFQQRANVDPQPALAQAESILRRLLEIVPDHESGQINLAGVLRDRYVFSAVADSGELDEAADEALSIYQRLERPATDQLEFGCMVADILVAQAIRQAPARRLAILSEAERLSRIEDNIDWLRPECLVTRAGIAIALNQTTPGIGLGEVVRIWEEISAIMAESIPEDAKLINAAARLAWSLEKFDLAADWSTQAAARNPQFAVGPPAERQSVTTMP